MTPLTSIQWLPAAETMPDTDTTVMIHHPAMNEPVWLGYHDGETWRTVESDRCDVSHWAELPDPPTDN